MSKDTVTVAARLPRAIYNRLVEHQARIASKSGIKPSVSEVVRLLVEQGLVRVVGVHPCPPDEADARQRRKGKS